MKNSFFARKSIFQNILTSFEKNPKSDRLLGVIRDPIERFRSGFSRASQGKTVDQVINNLLAGKTPNIHIQRITDQFSKVVDSVKWYCYETQMEQLAFDIGLEKVPDIKNESKEEDKPVLTQEQINKLENFYADDIVLYLKTKG